MRSSTFVCSEWNHLINDSKWLAKKKKFLDPYEKIKPKHQFGCSGCEEGKFLTISGICSLSDRILISDRSQYRIQIFSNRGQFISSFGSKGRAFGQFDGPTSICTDSGNVLVRESDNNRLQFFDSNFYPLKCFEFRGFYIQGMCFDSKGRILMTTSSGNIAVVDQDGKIVQEFGSYGTCNGQFTCPVGICVNSRGEILVADSWNNRIQIFNSSGEFLRSFGSKGNGICQLHYPHEICVDWQDNIYVTDQLNDIVHKHQVQQKSGGWRLHPLFCSHFAR